MPEAVSKAAAAPGAPFGDPWSDIDFTGADLSAYLKDQHLSPSTPGDQAQHFDPHHFEDIDPERGAADFQTIYNGVDDHHGTDVVASNDAATLFNGSYKAIDFQRSAPQSAQSLFGSGIQDFAASSSEEDALAIHRASLKKIALWKQGSNSSSNPDAHTVSGSSQPPTSAHSSANGISNKGQDPTHSPSGQLSHDLEKSNERKEVSPNPDNGHAEHNDGSVGGHEDREDAVMSDNTQSDGAPSDDETRSAHSVTATPAPTDRSGSRSISEPATHPWMLRQNARERVGAWGSWKDTDNTGTYDPSAKAQRSRPKKLRPASATKPTTANGDTPKSSSRSTKMRRLAGDRYCVKLSLSSPAGKELLSKGEDNWPDDIYINTVAGNAYAADESSDDVEADGPYHLRRPGQAAIASPIEVDLTGHPEGRGCKLCRELANHCSMTDHDGCYPCETCLNEHEPCEPLVEPVRKQSCEICREAGHGCSYAYDGSDHSKPCAHCSEKGFKCIAGPTPDVTRVRMDEHGNPALPRVREVDRSRTRKYKSCASCRRAGGLCSLLKTQAEPPCKSCKASNTPCTFEPTKRPPKLANEPIQKKARKKMVSQKGTLSPMQSRVVHRPAETAQSSPGDTPPTPARPSPISQESVEEISEPLPPIDGTKTLILTRLSHPITFMSDDPCHFCSADLPYYSLLGHLKKGSPQEARKVDGVLWRNGEAFTETDGGWRSKDGKPPSKMCKECTFARVRLIFCRQHVFRPIAWLKQGGAVAEEAKMRTKCQKPMRALANFNQVTQRAREATDEDKGRKMMRHELSRWCSICPSIATVECCAGDKMECTLRLCTICHKLLMCKGTHNGDLLGFVKKLHEKMGKETLKRVYPLGLRADYDLLKWNGFLMKQVKAQQVKRMKEAGAKNRAMRDDAKLKRKADMGDSDKGRKKHRVS